MQILFGDPKKRDHPLVNRGLSDVVEFAPVYHCPTKIAARRVEVYRNIPFRRRAPEHGKAGRRSDRGAGSLCGSQRMKMPPLNNAGDPAFTVFYLTRRPAPRLQHIRSADQLSNFDQTTNGVSASLESAFYKRTSPRATRDQSTFGQGTAPETRAGAVCRGSIGRDTKSDP